MSYYDTLTEDLARAREILTRGKPAADSLEGIESQAIISLAGGTIYGGDVYAAYKLLESFVAALSPTADDQAMLAGMCDRLLDEREDTHGQEG